MWVIMVNMEWALTSFSLLSRQHSSRINRTALNEILFINERKTMNRNEPSFLCTLLSASGLWIYSYEKNYTNAVADTKILAT